MMSIVALLLLAIFAALAVAYMAAANNTVVQADNQRNVQGALLAAESGLSFHTYVLRQTAIPAGVQDQAMLDALNASLASQSLLTGNLSSGLTYTGTIIRIPAINVDAFKRFDAYVTRTSSTIVSLTVRGYCGPVTRTVGMNYGLTQSPAFVPPCGIVTRSSVTLTGNDKIVGLNSAAEGGIYTSTPNTTCVTMTGNAKIGGDLYATNPAGQVSLTGNVSIGGATGSGANSHVHIGAPPFDIPEVDPSAFAPLATNIVDSHTSTSGNKTFTNIRIKANTNPTFAGNITINGIVYIEKPNKVSFSGNLTLNGMIATDPGHDTSSGNNQINFTGNTTTTGVENLPNTSDFAVLRTMPGAFLLAPGFTTKFTGNFGTTNGVMASEGYVFTGNAGGLVRGSIINYSNSNFTMTGNASLTFDHNTYKGLIPGLVGTPKFVADAATYVEPNK